MLGKEPMLDQFSVQKFCGTLWYFADISDAAANTKPKVEGKLEPRFTSTKEAYYVTNNGPAYFGAVTYQGFNQNSNKVEVCVNAKC